MLIRDVDFPESLLDAQQNGSLVIFAGAGVSMPPPSNYPNFDKLAELIADGVFTRQESEPVDYFLGHLVARGIRVHDRASQILSDPRRYLGIVPITYRLNSNGDKHSAVGLALAAWADLTNSGALQQEQKIKSIVELPFSVDAEGSDYIENALKDISTTRFFTRYAKGTEWLRWVEGKGLLSPLFQTGPPVGEIHVQLARWFAQNFVCEVAGDALAVFSS
jgi:hypothetical protein